MTSPATTHDAAHGAAGDNHAEHIHPASHYIKYWGILCVLLIVSFLGPIVAPHIFGDGPSNGKTALIIMTAFGIALVKAFMVCAQFMHLNIEKRLATMIVSIAVIIMALFFGGVSPDIMKHAGDHWVNQAADAETVRRIEREGANGEKLEKEVEARLEAHDHPGEHPGAKAPQE